MLPYRVSVSVWRLGGEPLLSYIEIDKRYDTLYRLTYAITEQEAVDLSRWANARIASGDADPCLDSFGWCIYLDPNGIIQPDITFKPSHSPHRDNPSRLDRYLALISRVHTSFDSSVH